MRLHVRAVIGLIIIFASLVSATEMSATVFQFNEQIIKDKQVIKDDPINILLKQIPDVNSDSSEKSNAIANSFQPDLFEIEIIQDLADITKLGMKDQNDINQFDFNSNKDLELKMENSFSQVIAGNTFNKNS